MSSCSIAEHPPQPRLPVTEQNVVEIIRAKGGRMPSPVLISKLQPLEPSGKLSETSKPIGTLTPLPQQDPVEQASISLAPATPPRRIVCLSSPTTDSPALDVFPIGEPGRLLNEWCTMGTA